MLRHTELKMFRNAESIHFTPQRQPVLTVDLDGVPTIPEDLARKVMRGRENDLTTADIERCDESIQRACEEMQRRKSRRLARRSSSPQQQPALPRRPYVPLGDNAGYCQEA